MYIQEIIIEGFKSYANRTVVGPFDPAFNAITGLNGSGKSNILDSICFVLGITSLSHVRVNNLQELVYKQGQSGINKASVTIIFNNSNTPGSPIGYEDYKEITVTRQIVIGGRHKYLINGINATANRVQTLFHSVQLNVNNPHFLIMQGRITKVLNMKPPEILAMIEEAAGTRMYESKKQSALKTIDKKQRKVGEIDTVLSQEINPTLEKLRRERTAYMQFANNQAEIERLARVVVAADFLNAECMFRETTEQLKGCEDAKSRLALEIEDLEKNITTAGTGIDSMQAVIEAEVTGELHSLEEQHQATSQEVVKFTTIHQHAKQEWLDEDKRLQNVHQQISDATTKIAKKRQEVEALTGTVQKDVELSDHLSNKYREAQQKFETLSTGLSCADGDQTAGKSLHDRIMESKKKGKEFQTEVKTLAMVSKNNAAQIKNKSQQLATLKNKGELQQNQLKESQTKQLKIEQQMEGLKFDEEFNTSLEQRVKTLEPELHRLNQTISRLSGSLKQLQHLYSDTKVPGVKGLVAEVVHINDPKAFTALEVCAGGRLYNLIVEDEITGKNLLKEGKLKRRLTIIPLSKIRTKPIPNQVAKSAQKIAPTASVALSLLGFKKDLEKAMEFVFGGHFIVETSDDAQRITFDNKIRRPSVTLEGDIFDPKGTLTGGSAPRSGDSLLSRLHELNEAKEKILIVQKEYSEVSLKLKDNLEKARQFSKLKAQLEIIVHEVELFQKKIASSEFHQIKLKIDQLEQENLENTGKINSLKLQEKKAQDEAANLEKEASELKKKREAELKHLKNEMTVQKKSLDGANKTMKQRRQQMAQFELEIQNLQTEIASLQETLVSLEETVERLKKSSEEHEAAFLALAEKNNTLKQTIKQRKSLIKEKNSELKKLIKQREIMQKTLSDRAISKKKQEHQLAILQKEQGNASQFIEQMLKSHTWIATDREFFGKKNTDYDFETIDLKDTKQTLEHLREQHSILSKTINKKVMTMFEKADQEYQDLAKKKQITERDRRKIEDVIKELDEKKNAALTTTWQKVNKDFGSIFQTLLPGTKAKLEPANKDCLFDGLIVRVAFGDKWKESLTELSGGQRSLLALSLILALLLFKPAPMYILDEIDAALDPSHTQNIGLMLKSHFKHSQFVVVSLKEGMFNNANVLFKTRCVDGVSSVLRTTPQVAKNKEKDDEKELTTKSPRGRKRIKKQ